MKVGKKMFRRDRDLTEVFNDRWRANHNKALEKTVRKNKINTIKRSFGITGTISSQNKLNKPIGYINKNGRR